MKREKGVAVTEQGLEKNAAKPQEGGAAVVSDELKLKSGKAQKDIAAESSYKGMKKK